MKQVYTGLKIFRDISVIGFYFLFFSAMHAGAQNIVPNSGFENYSDLPAGYGEWFKCEDWSNVNGYPAFMYPYASPDYLHNSGTGGTDLPACTFATLDPHEGDAIMGFITFLDYEANFREYLSAAFTSPMIAGNTYQISFWLSNGNSPMDGFGSDHIGMRFSTGPLTQIDHEPIGGIPQIEIPGIVFDNDWVYYEYTYIADDNYDHLTIGNFYNDASTSTGDFYAPGIGGAYYFIDEVSVIANDLFAVTIDTVICYGIDYILPDGEIAATSGTYIDTLVTAAGIDSVITTNLFIAPVYAFTIDASVCEGAVYTLPDGTIATDAGTYLVALLSSYNCDSIFTVHLSVDPFLTSEIAATICEGSTYILPDGTVISSAGVYTTTLISAGGCDSIITTTLNIATPTTTIHDVLLCTGSGYLLPDGTEVFSEGTYTSNLISAAGCDSIIITNLTYTDGFAVLVDTSMLEGQTITLPDGVVVDEAGTYTSNLISSGGCDSIITTNITIVQTIYDVDVPNAFSPNGDGMNDVFHINSNDVIVNSFTVYNRWGQLIYEAQNGIVAWDGRLNGIDQEVGMFIYILKYTSESELRTKSGTITLIR